jgi:hypothetical protein
MSGIDYQSGQVTKQDLLRLERYVQSVTRAALGTPSNVIDTLPKATAHQAITITGASRTFVTYFVPAQDQTVSTVTIYVGTVDATATDKQVAICSVGGVTDNTTLTILGTSASTTAVYTLGANNIALTTPVALTAGQQYAFVIKGVATTAAVVSGLAASANTALFGSSQRLGIEVSSVLSFGAVGTTLSVGSTSGPMIYARLS